MMSILEVYCRTTGGWRERQRGPIVGFVDGAQDSLDRETRLAIVDS